MQNTSWVGAPSWRGSSWGGPTSECTSWGGLSFSGIQSHKSAEVDQAEIDQGKLDYAEVGWYLNIKISEVSWAFNIKNAEVVQASAKKRAEVDQAAVVKLIALFHTVILYSVQPMVYNCPQLLAGRASGYSMDQNRRNRKGVKH